MTIKLILWTYKLREDGSCDIKIYVSHQARKKYISTDIKIQPADWDAKRQQVKRSYPLSDRINANLKRRVTEIATHLLDGWWSTGRAGQTKANQILGGFYRTGHR